MASLPTPFSLAIPDAELDGLRQRLALTRWPDQAPEPPWTYGTDLDYLRGLLAHWQDGFDWRAQEAALNAFPQFRVPLHGIDLHFLHVRGEGRAPMPLLLSHGWPGSVLEFLDLIPRLTQPSRFGGDPADAFTVVAPSLPGYGLSFRPGQKRFGIEAIADCLAELMTGVLGYRRFAAQGGDWGAFVASRLGAVHAEKLLGIHVNLLAVRRDPSLLEHPTEDERRYLGELKHFLREETGYQWIQGTRPQTLAYGLADSPAGLAAWIIEKFGPGPTTTARRTARWTAKGCWPTSPSTGSPAASARPSIPITRACTVPGRSPGTVDVPMGYCQFPKEILRPPRSLAARTYTPTKKMSVCRCARPASAAGAGSPSGTGNSPSARPRSRGSARDRACARNRDGRTRRCSR
jgi:microsomal epoxide hydrolase